jgi:hypothetical protein
MAEWIRFYCGELHLAIRETNPSDLTLQCGSEKSLHYPIKTALDFSTGMYVLIIFIVPS